MIWLHPGGLVARDPPGREPTPEEVDALRTAVGLPSETASLPAETACAPPRADRCPPVTKMPVAPFSVGHYRLEIVVTDHVRRSEIRRSVRFDVNE